MSNEDTRQLVELTVDEFLELLLSKDEREVLKAKVREYDLKLQEIHASMAQHKTAMAELEAKTLSTPFKLRSVEEFDKWAEGVRGALSDTKVKGIVLMMGTL